MTVVCKVGLCPYISKNGFCTNKLVSITQNGMCGHIYNKYGQIKANWQQKVSEDFMEKREIQEENGIEQ